MKVRITAAEVIGQGGLDLRIVHGLFIDEPIQPLLEGGDCLVQRKICQASGAESFVALGATSPVLGGLREWIKGLGEAA